MESFIILVFFIGYIAIALERVTKLDKLIPALLMMSICWATIALGLDSFSNWFDPQSGTLSDIRNFTLEAKKNLLEVTLLHHIGKTAEILIFLIGAMAIVEMIDHFDGFGAIKKMIKTKKKRSLLWIICAFAFVLSAIIDNLTATIVLISILRKVIPNKDDRMWFAGLIIIAANAGGAWTPIGDVTTTMLWMAGKVTSGKLMTLLFLPSLISVLVPLIIASNFKIFNGSIEEIETVEKQNKYSALMLFLGLFLIVFVPIFKTITHLPPYIGMLLALSVFSIIAEIITNRNFTLTQLEGENQVLGPTMKALTKIEMPSILFFLGILMTVAAMETLGIIFTFGGQVSAAIPEYVFVTLLGISSSIIDNVPLVAASIGMFRDATDATVWHFIAYAAGTGGSILIIGSAAGVVAMGMEKISFFWYFKKISLLALIGYLAGVGVFMAIS